VSKVRKERRELQREAVKDAKRRLSIAARERGGAPDLPQIVETASVIEPIARSTPCVVCGAEVAVVEHEAKTLVGSPVRVVHVKCRMCGVARKVYFQITPVN
jgi:uncharacterized protein with PIN domain